MQIISTQHTTARLSYPAFLFAATTFTASFLLFLVQPLFAKMALPKLGGSPSVWNACMLFFQTLLLLGYLYTHVAVRLLAPRLQAAVHVAVMATGMIALPLALPLDNPAREMDPVWWLLRVMTVSVGLPFFVLATMAPLVQRWFALLPVRSARDPYFLYATSNAGSMLALLAFPFLLEPILGVRSQAIGWTAGYVLLLLMTIASASTVWRYGTLAAGAAIEPETTATRIAAGLRLRWIFLSFVPSSLMLGVTTHISTDLAAVPLLWIVPLSLYLATFIIAFARRQTSVTGAAFSLVAPLSLAAIATILLRIGSPLLIFLHIAAFFAAALLCHSQLSRSRPPVAHLTAFYLFVSIGGMLGGVFNTLVAPHVFDGIYEYPLILALACFVRPPAPGGKRLEPWPLFVISAAVPLAVVVALRTMDASYADARLSRVLIIALIVIGGFWAFSRRRAPFNVSVSAAALLIALNVGGVPGQVIFADRSFFGVLKVIYDARRSSHVLQHGTTLHGRQDRTVQGSCEPLTYYHRSGPIGQVFANAGSRFRDVAVIGLGTGALACYAGPNQRMAFFEIDPLVEQIARDPRLFTYLTNSAGAVDVAIGDGRKLLEAVPEASVDLIVVDAFSSDAVPVHLLTREAVRTYSSKLRTGGMLAFHISNRYLNLESVLAAIAAAEGMVATANNDVVVRAEDDRAGKAPSHWVLVSRNEVDFGAVADQPGWRPLQLESGVQPWTDDYSNILDVIEFKGR